MGNCFKVESIYKEQFGMQDFTSQGFCNESDSFSDEELNCHLQSYYYQKVMVKKEHGSRFHAKLELTDSIIRANRPGLNAAVGDSEMKRLLKYRENLIAKVRAENFSNESGFRNNVDKKEEGKRDEDNKDEDKKEEDKKDT